MKSTTVKLYGQKINIEVYNASWDSSHNGQCRVDDNLIRIRDNLLESHQAATLIHEIVHYISHVNELKLDERNTRILETGIHEFLVNNYPLIKEIYEKLNKEYME